AVVSCPGCRSHGSGGDHLYPAGSILVTAKPKTSLAVRIVSYGLLVAFLVAAFFALRTYRRRRVPRRGPGVATLLGRMLIGPGPAASPRGARSWREDAAARPPAPQSRAPEAKGAARAEPGARPGRSAGRRHRKRRGG